jgi:hypothetical protein
LYITQKPTRYKINKKISSDQSHSTDSLENNNADLCVHIKKVFMSFASYRYTSATFAKRC